MKKWLEWLGCRRPHEEAEDIFEEMDRVFRVPRMVGIWPFSCRHSVRVSYSLLLLNIVLATSSMVLSIASAVILDFGIKNQFVYRVFTLLQLFGYSFSPFAALFPMFKLRQLDRGLAGVYSVDEQMRRNGFQHNSGTEVGESSLRWAHRIWFLTILSLKLYSIRLKMFYCVLALYWPKFCVLVMLDLIESSLAILRSRLDAVVVATKHVVSTSVTFRKLEELARCHYILCNSGALLNSFYSVTFLLLTAFYFVITVGGLYAVYYHKQPSHFNLYTDIITATWFLQGAITLCRITSCCVRITAKANEFNNLLSHHLMSNDKTNEILNNEKLRLHVVLNRGISFTACGFYDVDYTLLYSMIATAASYMVILIQFDEPPKTANSALPIVGEAVNQSSSMALAIEFKVWNN